MSTKRCVVDHEDKGGGVLCTDVQLNDELSVTVGGSYGGGSAEVYVDIDQDSWTLNMTLDAARARAWGEQLIRWANEAEASK